MHRSAQFNKFIRANNMLLCTWSLFKLVIDNTTYKRSIDEKNDIEQYLTLISIHPHTWRSISLSHVNISMSFYDANQCFICIYSCIYCHDKRGRQKALQWRHNGPDGVSNHRPFGCLLNRLFRRRSKKTSKRRVTGLCEWNSPMTGEFLAQRPSNAENVSIWWRHHDRDESKYTCLGSNWSNSYETIPIRKICIVA